MGEFSLTAIVLAMLGVGVGIAVYDNPRLGGAIIAAAVVVTLVYTLLRKHDDDDKGHKDKESGTGGSSTAGEKGAMPDPEA